MFSNYENYSITSNDYDKLRIPVGVDIMNKYLSNIENKPFSSLKVLDAGCGTGNYIEALYNFGIGDIYGIEINGGMYGQSLNKHKNKINENKVHLHQCSITSKLPFNDEMFDGICVNQVLHHLDDDISRKQNFQNIRNALTEIYRCLNNEHGVLFINSSTPIQSVYGIWYYQFIPDAAEVISSKLPTKEWFISELNAMGFKHVETYPIVDESLWNLDIYYDLNGIFNKEWRNTDSTFACCGDEELKYAQREVKNIINGDKHKFINDSEYKRQRVGHSTTFVAHK